MLPSSMLGFEALTGGLEDFGFEDYLSSKCHIVSILFNEVLSLYYNSDSSLRF